jgi:hypothetical protein
LCFIARRGMIFVFFYFFCKITACMHLN